MSLVARLVPQHYAALRDQVEMIARLVAMATATVSALDDEAADAMPLHAKVAICEKVLASLRRECGPLLRGDG